MSTSENKYEKIMKDSFDKHRAALDQEAFEKFQKLLDERNRKKRWIPIWFWGHSNIIFLVLFLFGSLAVSSHFLLQKSGENKYKKLTNDTYPTSEIVLKEKNNTQVEASDPLKDSASALERKYLGNSLENNKHLNQDNKNALNSKYNDANIKLTKSKTYNKNSKLNSGSKASNTMMRSTFDAFPLINNKNVEFKKNALNSEEDQEILEISKYALGNKAKDKASKSTVLEPLFQLDQKNIFINYKNDLPIPNLIEFKPDKYKKHFYVNLQTGISRSDKTNHYDPYIHSLSRNEGLIRFTIAYQLSAITSVELSLTRTRWSVGWGFKETNQTGFRFDRMEIVSLRMKNKLLSLPLGISLYLHNGIGLNTVNQYDSNRSSFTQEDLPSNVSLVQPRHEYLNSSKNLFYDTGLTINTNMSQNISLTFGINYLIGYKNTNRLEVDYTYGEGNIAKFESKTKSGFTSLELGLQYRFLKDE